MAKAKVKSEQKNNTLTYYIILALIAFAVYANSLSNEFTFDDESVVLGDPTITSLSNIPKYFTGEMGFHKVIGRYFRPVVSSSYAIDYALWNFKPFGFHLTNVLIHIINCLLFFRLLLLMFEKTQSQFKDYTILIAAVIFAVHPIHTEAVAWVSGRTDSLCATFFLASFIYYLKFSSSPKNLYLGLTLLFYLLALFAKEMAITLPAVIILYDIIVNRLNTIEKLKPKIKIYSSLVILSVLYLILRWAALKDVPQRETYLYFYGRDFATTLYTMIQTIPLYFRLSVLPYGMLYHYSGYLLYLSSPFEYGVLFAGGFILIIGFAAWYFYKRIPLISYGILFFFITLLPVLNIIPTMNFMADRFLYIPSIFLSLIAAAVIFKYYSEKNANIIIGICAVVIISYGFMTVSRNADWKTNDDLFMSAEGKPGTILYVNLGNIYANKGQFDTAEQYYRKAIELRVETVMGNNNLGKVFMVKENYDSAYFYMLRGHMLDTLSPEPMHALAQLNARFNKLPEAIMWLEKIHKIMPNYMNSAQMLNELKMKLLQQEVKLNPGELTKASELEQSSYKNYQSKNYAKAIDELTELIKLNPNGAAGYYNNIGMCYLDQSKYKEAAENFSESVKAKPDFSTAYNNLGQCYEKLGDKQKAIESYQKAVDTDPNNQIAKQNLDRIK